jgi:hypothetical protein
MKNEATQDDGWTSLSWFVKTSFGCRGLSQLHGDLLKVAYVDHVRGMVWDHT